MLCAGQYPIEIAAIVDSGNEPAFLGIPVVKSIDDVPAIDAVIVTDMNAGQETYDSLAAHPAGLTIRVPKILRVNQKSATK